MFLPKGFLELLLSERGITDWNALYLSNDVGLRKDGGDLYRHVLAQEGVSPGQMLMVGDNQRSDVQIPVDMGIASFHVLRPVEAARAMPRLSSLVEKVEGDNDPNRQLALGLVLRRAYSPIFFEGHDPASLFFPVPSHGDTASSGRWFCVCLADKQARRDGIDRLHFLSREGQSLKQVYDRWIEAIGGGPPSEYLVLSRRETTVPAIDSHADILNIARANYSTNTARSFLEERYGVELPKKRGTSIGRFSGVPNGK